MQELLAIRPDFAATARVKFEEFYEPELAEHLIEGLRKAGLEIPDKDAPSSPRASMD